MLAAMTSLPSQTMPTDSASLATRSWPGRRNQGAEIFRTSKTSQRPASLPPLDITFVERRHKGDVKSLRWTDTRHVQFRTFCREHGWTRPRTGGLSLRQPARVSHAAALDRGGDIRRNQLTGFNESRAADRRQAATGPSTDAGRCCRADVRTAAPPRQRTVARG
jgi:hypothetical protein